MIDLQYALLAALAILAGYIGYQRAFHPLARYPGPFWASLTNLWSLSLSTKGDWPRQLRALHARYGPVVRIAPNEVAIDKPEAIAAIYGLNQGNVKTAFYHPFGNPAQKPNLFNAVDDQYHGQLRRWAGNVFSNKATADFQPLIQSGIVTFLHHLEAKQGQVVDLAVKFREIAFDLSALISCGHTFDAINQGDSTGLMKAMFISNSAGAHFGRFPMAQFLLTKLAPPPELVRGFTFMSEFFHEKLMQHKEDIQHESEAHDQMSLLLKQSTEKSDSPYTLLEPSIDARIKEMCQTVIAAGSETTGSTLTALVFYVATTPGVLSQLLAEIDACEVSDDGTFPASVVVRMPYLDAVIKETLRMYPTVGYSLPRKVRSGGLVVGNDYFAAGTNVGVNAWQIHQHAEIFGDQPSKFRPERWQSGDKEATALMDRHMFSFGAGSRTCVGKHISLLEMRLLVPALYRQFEIQLVNKAATLSYQCHWFALPDALQVLVKKRSSPLETV